MQIHERYFPEIEVHYEVHRFMLIFSLPRLPKGEIKEKILLLPGTPNQEAFIDLKGDHQTFCHILFSVTPCWF